MRSSSCAADIQTLGAALPELGFSCDLFGGGYGWVLLTSCDTTKVGAFNAYISATAAPTPLVPTTAPTTTAPSTSEPTTSDPAT